MSEAPDRRCRDDRQDMTRNQIEETRAAGGAGTPQSRQVDWWSVHQFLETVVAQANCGPLPIAGTPGWCAMSDGDPRKLIALAVAGEHHVLRTEAAQTAMAEASHEISTAADWSALARRIQTGRGSAYIPRKVAS